VRIKASRGRDALGLCRYVLQPEKIFAADGTEQMSAAGLVLGNMVGKTPEYLAKEFWISQCLRPGIKVNVAHYSISFPPGENLDDESVDRLSKFMLEKMGHSIATQFFAVRHFDRQEEKGVAHFHVVASAIGLDGHVCKSSWNWTKAKKVEREVEIEFGLSEHPIQASPRYITTGEYRQRVRLGQPTTKEKLWVLIDEAASGSPNFQEFRERLVIAGVELRIRGDEDAGEISGLSYGLDGMGYSGSQLGKRYSLRGVQEELGVKIDLVQPYGGKRYKLQFLEKDLGVKPVVVDAQVIDVPPLPEPKEKKRSRGLER
jgi:hypothetical protein